MLSVIIAFELVAIISRHYEENTGHLQFSVLKIYTKISHIIERDFAKTIVFKVITFELVAIISDYYEENTCYQHSIC